MRSPLDLPETSEYTPLLGTRRTLVLLILSIKCLISGMIAIAMWANAADTANGEETYGYMFQFELLIALPGILGGLAVLALAKGHRNIGWISLGLTIIPYCSILFWDQTVSTFIVAATLRAIASVGYGYIILKLIREKPLWDRS